MENSLTKVFTSFPPKSNIVFNVKSQDDYDDDMEFETEAMKGVGSGKKMEFGPGVTVNFLEHEIKRRSGQRRVRFAKTDGYVDHDSSFGMQVSVDWQQNKMHADCVFDIT